MTDAPAIAPIDIPRSNLRRRESDLTLGTSLVDMYVFLGNSFNMNGREVLASLAIADDEIETPRLVTSSQGQSAKPASSWEKAIARQTACLAGQAWTCVLPTRHDLSSDRGAPDHAQADDLWSDRLCR